MINGYNLIIGDEIIKRYKMYKHHIIIQYCNGKQSIINNTPENVKKLEAKMLGQLKSLMQLLSERSIAKGIKKDNNYKRNVAIGSSIVSSTCISGAVMCLSNNFSLETAIMFLIGALVSLAFTASNVKGYKISSKAIKNIIVYKYYLENFDALGSKIPVNELDKLSLDELVSLHMALVNCNNNQNVKNYNYKISSNNINYDNLSLPNSVKTKSR